MGIGMNRSIDQGRHCCCGLWNLLVEGDVEGLFDEEGEGLANV